MRSFSFRSSTWPPPWRWSPSCDAWCARRTLGDGARRRRRRRALRADRVPLRRRSARLLRPRQDRQDFRGFALDLAWRLAHAPPDARHLILVERNHPGYLGNPLLDFYLRAYGLADRVVLRGFADPSTVARLAATCRDGCRGVQDGRLESALGAGSPFAQAPLIRKLIDLREPMGTWPANVEGVSLVLYSSFVGAGGVPGLRSRSYRGFVVFEPAS